MGEVSKRRLSFHGGLSTSWSLFGGRLNLGGAYQNDGRKTARVLLIFIIPRHQLGSHD